MRKLWRWTWRIAVALVVAVVVYLLVPIAPTIPAMRPRPDTEYWSMSRGYRIAYTHVPARGEARRAPIVYLHGGPGGYVHSSIVRTLSPLASEGHDLYFYDQVGSGLSDRLPRPSNYSFLGHVADLREILATHLGGVPAVVIGHSYGAVLGAEVLARHPELVERLVLSSPGVLQPTAFDEKGRWVNERKYPVPASLRFVEPPQVAMDGVRFWPPRVLAAMAVATVLDAKLMSDAEADGVLNTLAGRFTKGGVCNPANVQPEEGGGGLYAYGRSNWFGDHEHPGPLLRQRHVPAIVLQGACDYLPYAGAYEYVDLLPEARYVFVENAGHILWWDQPERYYREIAAFLREPLPERPARIEPR